MKIRNDIELQMRRRDDAFTKAITNWLHSVGVRAEEIVEERGSHQAGGHTYSQTDKQQAACPGQVTCQGAALALSASLSQWAGWVVRHTDRRLDSLGGEGRGREQ